MLKEEIIRKENKEISELLLTIFKNVKNDYQKKKIEDLKRIEKEKNEKYDIEKIFKERNKNREIELATEEIAMIEYNESIFTRIKNWFKRLFNK